MKRLLLLLTLLFPVLAGAQTQTYQGNTTTTVTNRGAFVVDSVAVIPLTNGTPVGFPAWYPAAVRRKGAEIYDTSTHKLWLYDGQAWRLPRVYDFSPEDVAYKSTDTLLGASNTLYPSQKAVKTYVDNAITAGGGYTDEMAQDAVGNILSNEFTYDDATPGISINQIAQSKVFNLEADIASRAPINNPTFTGAPAAPTASPGTSTTQLATTAFVTNAVATASTSIGINKLSITASAGTTVTDGTLSGKTVLWVAVNNFPYYIGFSHSTSTITFTDGTVLATGDTVTVFYR